MMESKVVPNTAAKTTKLSNVGKVKPRCHRYTNAAGNQDMIKIELNYSLRAHLFEPMTRTFATDRYARTYGFFGGDRAVLLGAGRGGAAGGRGAGRPAPDGNAFPRPEGPEHTMPRRGVDPLDTARYILAARSAIEGKIY